MTITQTQAQTAAGYLKVYGTAAVAAHQVSVQRRAIQPYTSRDLEAAQTVLRRMAAIEETKPEQFEKVRQQLAAIAERSAS